MKPVVLRLVSKLALVIWRTKAKTAWKKKTSCRRRVK